MSVNPHSPFINLFVLVSAKMSDYRLWAWQMEPGRFRLVHNKMFHVRFGCASALCLYWLCITQTTSRVSSSSLLSAISIKLIGICLCVVEIKAEHKDNFVKEHNFQITWQQSVPNRKWIWHCMSVSKRVHPSDWSYICGGRFSVWGGWRLYIHFPVQ